jgi:hypothetical protein
MNQWTVKRPEPEQSPGARFGSYLFGVVLFASIGGVAAAFLPLFVATSAGGGRRKGESYTRRALRHEVADAAMDTTINDTEKSMKGRVLIGALLGAAAGGFLAFKTEASRKKKQGLS